MWNTRHELRGHSQPNITAVRESVAERPETLDLSSWTRIGQYNSHCSAFSHWGFPSTLLSANKPCTAKRVQQFYPWANRSECRFCEQNIFSDEAHFHLVSLLCKTAIFGTWFQKDGATCHTACETYIVLHEFAPGRVISLFPSLVTRIGHHILVIYHLWTCGCGVIWSHSFIPTSPRALKHWRPKLEIPPHVLAIMLLQISLKQYASASRAMAVIYKIFFFIHNS